MFVIMLTFFCNVIETGIQVNALQEIPAKVGLQIS